MSSPLADYNWIRNSFIAPPNGANTPRGGSESGGRRRLATSASYKYTNTRLGGNWAINNPPQFTRYADIRQPGIGRTEKEWTEGMGRYYSEAIDDTRQVIHMSFGVPRYNSMVNFFDNFYDSRAARLANTGRSSSAYYNLGLVGGFIVSLPLQPFIFGLGLIRRVVNMITNHDPSKWYYFKPTMHAYWTAVNTIANELAVNLGLIPRVFGEDDKAIAEPGQRVDEATIKDFHRIMPHLFRPDGGVDVLALANRTQRIANQAYKAEAAIRDNAQSLDELETGLMRFLNRKVRDPFPEVSSKQLFADTVAKEGEEEFGTSTTESFTDWGQSDGWLKKFAEHNEANLKAGSMWTSFRVNNRGAMTESFSNSTRESDVAQMFNQKVAQGRAIRFSLMDGNVTDAIGSFVGAAADALQGGLDAVRLGGLTALAGSAFVDVPKMWDNSTANLPRAEYTIPLYSPYGNKISRYMNLYIPIAMLLAASLPRSAGKSSYTSPFLCQIFHQGRVQCQLGMVDSITISRGTGNVGWNAENEMLGAEITISVVDMSSVMHMPIKGAFGSDGLVNQGVQLAAATVGEAAAGDQGAAVALGLTSTSATWDEQSVFGDYMSVLGGLSVEDLFYARKRLSLNVTKQLRAFETWRSMNNFMLWSGTDVTARAFMQFAQTTDRF